MDDGNWQRSGNGKVLTQTHKGWDLRVEQIEEDGKTIWRANVEGKHGHTEADCETEPQARRMDFAVADLMTKHFPEERQ
jgi:hypothetical protein